MPSSTLSGDLGFLVAEGSTGRDPGVQWTGRHAWLDKVYKIAALSSLPFWNIPPLLQSHVSHPTAWGFHSWDPTLPFHWIFSSFLTTVDHLHSPISTLRAPLLCCALPSNAYLLAKICQVRKGGQPQRSSLTGAKRINCTASGHEELIQNSPSLQAAVRFLLTALISFQTHTYVVVVFWTPLAKDSVWPGSQTWAWTVMFSTTFRAMGFCWVSEAGKYLS